MKEIPLETQKMETLGRLTSAVIHDLNNMLTIIQLNAALLELGGLEEGDGEKLAGEIGNACSHAANLTRSVLALARKGEPRQYRFDVNEVVLSLQPLIDIIVAKKTTVAVALAPESLWVDGNRSEFSQALLNLVINAADASPRAGVSIAVRPAHHSDKGEMVEIAVTDTGTGISPETVIHIFEPFFTTKATGKGTGLGLDIVRRVASTHDGLLEMTTEVGVGTTFRLLLPIAHTKIEDTENKPASPAVTAEANGRTILIVEDDRSIRSIGSQILRKRGWQVLEATDAEEATALWREHAESIDLLFTDLILPGLSGDALARQLVAEKPTLAVLYTSGNTEAADEVPELTDENFVSKPYQPAALIEACHRQCAKLPPVSAGPPPADN